MANYTQACSDDNYPHEFHGSFQEGGHVYDVYTIGPARVFCVRHGSALGDYTGYGPLNHVIESKLCSVDPIALGALHVLAASEAEVRNIIRQRRQTLWVWACEHDGIDPASKFVVFSDDNPFMAEHDALPNGRRIG